MSLLSVTTTGNTRIFEADLPGFKIVQVSSPSSSVLATNILGRVTYRTKKTQPLRYILRTRNRFGFTTSESYRWNRKLRLWVSSNPSFPVFASLECLRNQPNSSVIRLFPYDR